MTKTEKVMVIGMIAAMAVTGAAPKAHALPPKFQGEWGVTGGVGAGAGVRRVWELRRNVPKEAIKGANIKH